MSLSYACFALNKKRYTLLGYVCYPGHMKCYYEECKKPPIWHIFVEPGTFACDLHAPGDYSEPI
jgi:hypothetical protein